MLKSLSIKNYALISNLSIEFNEGLSIITGETGAGKSILLGALSLILGQRADTSVLLDKSSKCIVEASFRINGYDLEALFEDQDIDYEDISIFRREINSNGKSRAFINDTPINLSVLRQIVLKLIDIHSQHQNLELSNHQFQLNIVDSVAKHDDLIQQYQKNYTTYNSLLNKHTELVNQAGQAKADLDYYQFQYDQLQEAKLNSGEQEELEKELEILNHSEEIKTTLLQTSNTLTGEGASILNMLKDVKILNDRIIKFYSDAEETSKRLDSTYIELNDLAREIEIQAEKIEYDPGRIQFINERLDLIYNLLKKHRVGSIVELLRIKDELENKLDNISSYDEQIESIEKKLDATKELVNGLADKLSNNRKEVIPKIERTIIEILKELGMPNAKFQVLHQILDIPTKNGIDEVLFQFSANKYADLQEVSKIASGGEISRLMLSLKSLITSSAALPSIIFDEIDAGVSGEIADKMGNIIKLMSEKMQVINITHLPQIASKGNNHYKVYKVDKNNSTSTHIKLLNTEERLNEIAKMLSGKELTEAALINAKELLSN